MSKWCETCWLNQLTGKWHSCEKSCPVFGKSQNELEKMVVEHFINDAKQTDVYKMLEMVKERIERLEEQK